MKAGPKRDGDKTALPCPKSWPKSGPERAIKWIERFCTVPRGHGAGKKVRLREFQREIIRGSFSSGVRTALVSLPRGNGKTSLAAMLAVWALFDGPEGSEVLIVASSQSQAEITLRLARRMIELNPELSKRAQIYRDRIKVARNDGLMIALSAEPDGLHGFDPYLLIVDELHVVTAEVWEAATTASGKRPESLTFAISTPANTKDSVMWPLVEHGRDGKDKSFFLKEFAAPDDCDIDDKEAWKIANPAMADKNPFLAEDAMEAVMKTSREASFRRLRLGQWVYDMSKWLADEKFKALENDNVKVHPKTPVVGFFDGSASGDSTALVACTLPLNGEKPHIFTIGHWANPGDPRWRVPRAEVIETIEQFFEDYNVVELACDPWGWRTEIEALAKKFGPTRVIEWPTNVISRMAPATDRFYAMTIDEKYTHDGNDDLRHHIANCVAKSTPHGDVIVKQRKGSPLKIDLAVCAIGALDRAHWHANNQTKKKSKKLRVI